MRGSDTLIVAPGAASITVTGPAGTRSVPVAEGITYLHLSSMELGAPVTVTSLGPDGTTLQQITVMESRNPGPPSGPANADNSGVPSPP